MTDRLIVTVVAQGATRLYMQNGSELAEHATIRGELPAEAAALLSVSLAPWLGEAEALQPVQLALPAGQKQRGPAPAPGRPSGLAVLDAITLAGPQGLSFRELREHFQMDSRTISNRCFNLKASRRIVERSGRYIATSLAQPVARGRAARSGLLRADALAAVRETPGLTTAELAAARGWKLAEVGQRLRSARHADLVRSDAEGRWWLTDGSAT